MFYLRIESSLERTLESYYKVLGTNKLQNRNEAVSNGFIILSLSSHCFSIGTSLCSPRVRLIFWTLYFIASVWKLLSLFDSYVWGFPCVHKEIFTSSNVADLCTFLKAFHSLLLVFSVKLKAIFLSFSCIRGFELKRRLILVGFSFCGVSRPPFVLFLCRFFFFRIYTKWNKQCKLFWHVDLFLVLGSQVTTCFLRKVGGMRTFPF